VLQNDLYAVIGSILVIGVVFLIANLAVDLLQLRLNPRLLESDGLRPMVALDPTRTASAEAGPA